MAGAFFDRLYMDVNHRYGANMGTQINAYVDLPHFDLRDVDMALVNSPVRRGMLKKQIQGSEAA